MKKLLSILSICLVFISCSPSPDRVLMGDLTTIGPKTGKTLKYFEGKPFTGVAYNLYSNGQLWYEAGYKDGKTDGLQKGWFKNGQLKYEQNVKMSLYDGLWKEWDVNGRLESERNFKNGKQINLPPKH